jgi:hypothetical protein
MSCVQTRANRGVTLARQVVANEDDEGETDQCEDHPAGDQAGIYEVSGDASAGSSPW